MQDLTSDKLKAIALAWLEDVHDFCNVAYHWDKQDPERAKFNQSVRDFRMKRPWLMDNLRDDEHFNYLAPANGTVMFYGIRRAPNDSETLLFIANMEGAPRTIKPLDLPIPNLAQNGWEIALTSFGFDVENATDDITFEDSQAVIFMQR